MYILLLVLLVFSSTCGRPPKHREPVRTGPTGPAGESCTVSEVEEGTHIKCGTTETTVKPGNDGQTIIGPQGPAGDDGRELVAQVFTVSVNRNVIPWDENHKAEINAVLVSLPMAFQLYALPSTGSPHQGWLDIKLDEQVFCYQREMNSYQYTLRYRKQAEAVLGCDSNSEKESAAYSTSVPDVQHVQVIPRDPKLANLTWTFEIVGFVYGE